jgi:hypothetical protein
VVLRLYQSCAGHSRDAADNIGVSVLQCLTLKTISNFIVGHSAHNGGLKIWLFQSINDGLI